MTLKMCNPTFLSVCIYFLIAILIFHEMHMVILERLSKFVSMSLTNLILTTL